MANLMSEKLNKIFKLLSQHKSTMISHISDDYICSICKNILVNAHQAICGCHFCHECINQYIISGAIYCPGNTEGCKLENLSNISTNHRLNQQISKLIVKCPNKMCGYECQLIEMEEHMRFCSSKSVKCPFNDVGCKHEEMANDKLNEHLLLEIHNHNKILIDLIGNLKNEVMELKYKEERNRLEIEILKENVRNKDERIESLKEDIKLIKKENIGLAQQMEVGNRNLWYKLNTMDIEMNDKCKNEVIKLINDDIKSMKMDQQELTEQIKILKKIADEKVTVDMNSKLYEMRQEWSENLEKAVKKIKEDKEKSEMEIITKVNHIDKFLNMRDDGVLWWPIGQISEIKGWMYSDFFCDRENPYKMRLGLKNDHDKFNIWLFIYSGAFDADLKWPCQADTTITMTALNDVTERKLLTKSLNINKPVKGSYQYSAPITFSHSDLRIISFIEDNCALACVVKLV